MLVNGENRLHIKSFRLFLVHEKKKKSMPNWKQLFSLILLSFTICETAGGQSGCSEPWWGAAFAQSRPCMACWTIRWSVAWDLQKTAAACFLSETVACRWSASSLYTIINHHHYHNAAEFLTLCFYPRLTPVPVLFRLCTSEEHLFSKEN